MSRDVQGQRSPGIFAPALVPGQRDTGRRKFLCPQTKGQWDVLSQIVPGCLVGPLVPWKPYRKLGQYDAA